MFNRPDNRRKVWDKFCKRNVVDICQDPQKQIFSVGGLNACDWRSMSTARDETLKNIKNGSNNTDKQRNYFPS